LKKGWWGKQDAEAREEEVGSLRLWGAEASEEEVGSLHLWRERVTTMKVRKV
jgi:hypothetical protein